MKWTRFSYK